MREAKIEALKLKERFKSKSELINYLDDKIASCDYDEITFWEDVKWNVFIMSNW